MRPLLLLIGLLTLFPVLAFAEPAPSTTLDASMEQPVCQEGQPAVLALALHNSGTERYIIDGSAFEESSFQIAVTDSAGKAVPRTAVGERVLTSPMATDANSTVALSPGQTILYRFNLARLFDLSRSETYTINVSRRLRPQVWPLTVPSAVEPLPQVFTLTAHPLTVRMTEDATSFSGSTAYAPSPSRQPFLYMTGPGRNGVGRYRVGEDGSVSFAFPPAYTAPMPPAKEGFHSIITTPDGRFLYVSNNGDHTVSQFRIGDDGVLLPLFPPTVPAHSFPSYPTPLLMDPRGHYLYDLSGTLYAIGADGRLTVTASVSNDPPPKNSGPPSLGHDYNVTASENAVMNTAGTFLYTSLGLTRGYRLAPDGALTALSPPIGLPSEQNRSNDMALALVPSGKFAYVGTSTTLSNAFFDQIVTMRVAPDGTLSALPGVTIPKGPPSEWPHQSQPDCAGLAVDPSGHFLIVINPQYLACYRIGLDGSLAPLESKVSGAGFSSVLFGPVGHILYAVDRYADKFTAFRLDDRLGLVPAGVNLPSGLLIADCIGSAYAPTPLRWGEAVGGVMVSASLPADVLPANAPVVLTVRLKNITKHPIRLGVTGEDMSSFRLVVAGPPRQYRFMLRSGYEPVIASTPLLAAGHDLLDAPSPFTVPVILPPGGQRQYRFVLSRLADLTVAGNYTVQITRALPSKAAVASPVVPFLLDGPFDGRVRDDKYSVQIL